MDEREFIRFKGEVEDLPTLYSIDIVDLNQLNEDYKKLITKNMLEIKNGKIRS